MNEHEASMGDRDYIMANTADTLERERLRILEQLNDPITTERMSALGVADGWSCLEIGAGSGSIARWLAGRVGDRGTVVATDIDLRFLGDLDLANVEVRKHDVLTDPLESERYDLVHCRAVLMHLTEPKKALAHMADAVRPGGWLFMEEGDFGSRAAADLDHPFAETFNRLARTTSELMRAKGMADSYFGRTARSLVEDLRWLNLGHQGTTRVVRGGEPAARFWQIAAETVGARFVAAGV
jgi:SAM-dependent methyltransferase